MNKKTIYLASFLIFFCVFHSMAQNNTDIIPYPQNIKKGEGYFKLTPQIQLITSDSDSLTNEVSYLQSLLSSELGVSLNTQKGQNSIELKLSENIKESEGYTLNISNNKITISAADKAGIFYAIQTLNQLLLLNNCTSVNSEIPVLEITDSPAFYWRGSMLDVSRHFLTIDYLKRHIDRLAFYKLNKFHIHLTDDQGWRVEIKKYPKLTTVGGYRSFNNHDSICAELAKTNPDFENDSRFISTINGEQKYGGYYTQDELRDLVAYAGERHVEIIPEIDMPGHMMAAISAYPELVDGEIGWGELFSTPICACKDEVYTFVEDVIDEVITIFPSQYIHIGADEVDKTSWKESALCKELMQKEGIADYDKLQSYFIHRVQDMIEGKGKKVIAWDEALDGGIDSSVNIMYWRGWVANSPQKATQNGNPVIMSPTNPLYFDTFPDKSTLRNVYNMNIVYDNVASDKAHLVRGAQANLWAEKIPTENRVDFLLFPQLTALAERTWTNQNLFDAYMQRLLSHYPILDKMDISYRLPDLCGFAMESVFVKDSKNGTDKTGKAFFQIESPLADKTIHYTIDGSIPTKQSPILSEAIEIEQPQTIKFALFSQGEARSKGDIYTINYKESTFAAPYNTTKELISGLKGEYFNQPIDKVANISGQADSIFTINNIIVPKSIKAPQFGIRYNGYIDVPETGIYSFYLTCDDAGMLYVADRLVIDNEGPHSPIEKSGQVALEKGRHPFRLDFVEGGGGYTLLLQYSMDGCDIKNIPDNWFTH